MRYARARVTRINPSFFRPRGGEIRAGGELAQDSLTFGYSVDFRTLLCDDGFVVFFLFFFLEVLMGWFGKGLSRGGIVPHGRGG